MQIQVMPEAGIKGRGLAYHGSKILEYQTALAVEAENDYQRMEIIKEECQRMRQSWTKKMARQVPEIPEKPTWSIFRELEEFDTMCADVSRLPIGYDAANARVYGIPLDRTYCYLFWGANKTGKENALRMAIQSAMCKDSEICIIDSPEKMLKNYEAQGNITYACDEDSVFNFFASLLPEFKRRNMIKRELIEKDYEEHEIFERMSQEKPYFIFISDFSWFVPFIYSAEKDMKPFLENIIAKGTLHNIYFISTMALENKDKVAGYQIYELFKSHKTGMHFGGKVNNNPSLSFDYLSYMEQSKAEKPNIGQIPDAGEEKDTKKVVVPNAKK
jgi:S-DNA-T family DNA segregation ATPase FtsK/SpoIIIE